MRLCFNGYLFFFVAYISNIFAGLLLLSLRMLFGNFLSDLARVMCGVLWSLFNEVPPWTATLSSAHALLSTFLKLTLMFAAVRVLCSCPVLLPFLPGTVWRGLSPPVIAVRDWWAPRPKLQHCVVELIKDGPESQALWVWHILCICSRWVFQ